jgi:hypothetical protein
MGDHESGGKEERRMRTTARVLACVIGFAAAATVVALDPARGLEDLIGARVRHGNKQMGERGYVLVRSVDQGANELTYWRESRTGWCLSVRSANGRYAAFNYAPDSECDGRSGQVGYGGGGSWSESEDSGSHGVTLHRDRSFTGVSETFTGDVPDLRATRVGDDHATSVSISRRCHARLYQDLNYEGAYTEVDSNIGDLRGSPVGDDSVTSLRVRCDAGGGSDDRDGEWSEGGGSGDRGVTLHRDRNFTGVSETFTGDVPDLRVTRVGDDHATSVSISRRCHARLYQDLNYEGAYTEVNSNIGDLRGSPVGDDSVTSLQVRCDR